MTERYYFGVIPEPFPYWCRIIDEFLFKEQNVDDTTREVDSVYISFSRIHSGFGTFFIL